MDSVWLGLILWALSFLVILSLIDHYDKED
jgi:hypothetical protein